MSNRRRDLLNVGSQVATKFVSVPFSLVATGLAVRAFSTQADYLLLAVANYLAMLGLLQAGMRTYVARRVSKSFAETGVLADMPDVRGAFWLMAAVGTLAGVALLFHPDVPPEVAPSALLLLSSLSLGMADNVRLAIGEALKSNLFMLASYVLCVTMLTIALLAPVPNLMLALLAITAPQYAANLMSFAFMIRRGDFRDLVRFRRPLEIWRPLRDAFPLFMFAFGTTALLNAPLASEVLPGFPALSIESLACLRLFSNGQNVYYFLLLPLMPIVIREHHLRPSASFRTFFLRLLGGLLALNVVGGVFFALVGPWFIRLWLGDISVSADLAAQWGVIVAMWLAIVTAAYFFQVMFHALRGVAALCIAVLGTLAAPYLIHGASVEVALITGLLAGLVAAGVLALDSMRRVNRRDAAGSAPEMGEGV